METTQTTNEPREVQFGRTLRSAREASGLDRDACARALRLPVRIVRRLEEGDYAGMHPVFLRNYLRTYGQYVGVPDDILHKAIVILAPDTNAPELVSTGGVSHSRFLWQRYTTAATYVVLTAVIVVPLVWLGLQDGVTHKPAPLNKSFSTVVATAKDAGVRVEGSTKAARADTSTSQTQTQAATSGETAHATPAPNAAEDATSRPLMASMAPFSALDDANVVQPLTPTQAHPETRPSAPVQATANSTPASPATPARSTTPNIQAPPQVHTLQITLTKPCWIAITTDDGTRLAYGLLQPGTTHTYRSSQTMHVTVGNSSGATVTLDGHAFDLSPYLHANVARFHVDGAADSTTGSAG